MIKLVLKLQNRRISCTTYNKQNARRKRPPSQAPSGDGDKYISSAACFNTHTHHTLTANAYQLPRGAFRAKTSMLQRARTCPLRLASAARNPFAVWTTVHPNLIRPPSRLAQKQQHQTTAAAMLSGCDAKTSRARPLCAPIWTSHRVNK